MHIPIMLCGLVCGWKYGLLVGFIAPVLRSSLFGMPPLYPVAISMMFELAAYGFIIGLLYHKFQKKQLWWLYCSLVSAMIGGRIVWGIAKTILFGVSNKPFTFEMFIAGGFVDALPGIVLQLVLIPLIMRFIKSE